LLTAITSTRVTDLRNAPSQSVDGTNSPIILLQSKLKEVMGKLHARFSGQYLVVSNTLSEVKQHYCGYT
jgi:hypothetical protein